jgi:hypothetical protein
MQHMNFDKALAGALCLTFVASAVHAQSLADVARREEERRKAVGAPSRVYTNDNLRGSDPAPPPSRSASAPAAAAPATSAPASGTTPASSGSASGQATSTPAGAGAAAKDDAAKGKDGKEKGEAYWRQRMQQVRDAQQRAEVVAAALQSRINALSADVVNRDDPAQRGVIAADRDKALQELDRVKKELQEHAKSLADTQEEARRSGVPAGWVR